MATLAVPPASVAQILATSKSELPVPVTIEKEAPPIDSEEKLSASLSGKIVDSDATEEDEWWLGDLTVRLISGEDEAVERSAEVDEEGNYLFTDLPSGLYELRISGVGFQKKVIANVPILEGHVTEQHVDLKRSGSEESFGYGFGGAIAIPDFANDLVRAASENDLKSVRSLLRSGADPNSPDENYDGITALFLAVENNDLPMIQLLLEFGADVHRRDDSGNTAFARIDRETSPQIAHLLVRHGADVDVRDSDGMTPLMEAARMGNTELIRALITLGADMASVDEDGNTALVIAASGDEFDSVKLLLEVGADVGAENKNGANAYDVTGNTKIERLLVLHGSRSAQPEYSSAVPRLPTADETDDPDSEEPSETAADAVDEDDLPVEEP